jgi:hypothetical protein
VAPIIADNLESHAVLRPEGVVRDSYRHPQLTIGLTQDEVQAADPRGEQVTEVGALVILIVYFYGRPAKPNQLQTLGYDSLRTRSAGGQGQALRSR